MEGEPLDGLRDFLELDSKDQELEWPWPITDDTGDRGGAAHTFQNTVAGYIYVVIMLVKLMAYSNKRGSDFLITTSELSYRRGFKVSW